MNIAPAWPPSPDNSSTSRVDSDEPQGELADDEVKESEPWDVPSQRRLPRWVRRWLVVLLVVLTVLGGWFWIRYRHQASQRAAAEKLERFGGDAAFYRKNVVQLSFSGPRFRDEALETLSDFPHLSRLVLIDTSVSADGLRYLDRAPAEFAELAIIEAPPMGPEGLGPLSTLSSLRVLRLTGVPLADESLEALAGLKQLERLDLIDTGITDAALPHLAGLASLKTVLLNRTQVTRNGVETLQRALPKTTIVYDAESP